MLELPVGSMVHRYAVPRLGPDETHEESFTIRTERRGVIPVGPATTRRGDPLAMLSRDVEWTDVVEILVRPPMVPMDSLGAGLLRDLEGVSTDAVSQSDLAFHALREYVPGDDLRHVHWRSSAKAMAAADDTQLLVRQYLDTRRSHVTVVVDDTAGRVGRRARTSRPRCRSPRRSSSARRSTSSTRRSSAGPAPPPGVTGHLALDSVCRAELGHAPGWWPRPTGPPSSRPTPACCSWSAARPATSRTSSARSAAFPPEVRRYAVIVDPPRPSRVTETGGLVVRPGGRQGRPRRAAPVDPGESGDEVLPPAHPEPGPLGRRSTPRSCSR